MARRSSVQIDAWRIGFDDAIGALTSYQEVIAVMTLSATEFALDKIVAFCVWAAAIGTNNLSSNLHLNNLLR